MQALSDEAQWHINQGKDLPPDFMQRMQDIELPAEILSLFDMNLDSGMQYDYEQHTDFHGDPLYQDGGTQYDYEQHTDFPGDPLYPERYTDEAD